MTLKNKRMLAFIIDLIIIVAIIQLFSLGMSTEVSEYRLTTEHYTLVSRMSYDFVYCLVYFLVFDLFGQGITIGKKATNLRIIHAKRLAIGRNDLVKRTFLKMVSIVLLPVSALVYLLFNKTLHDELMELKIFLSKE
ncbi:RDD family protein [uncultured Muriicola sp.]|uniref:RDD family protein n=1 Tax=uncultured Muriicola sp. TaxID=1583102 RepID=UPI00260E595C|nr:RDD family protein [uncultured Muriicola sp.]